MLGRSIAFLSPTHSLVFLSGFSLLLILFSPSPVFFIPTSSNSCTFTKMQETHKGSWVLSQKNLFKYVTHYTIPTQKTHYTGCPETSTTWINHTFWIQAASSAQIIASNENENKAIFPLVSPLIIFFLSFPLSFTFFSLKSSLPQFHFPPSHVIFIPHYPLSSGFYWCCLRKKPVADRNSAGSALPDFKWHSRSPAGPARGRTMEQGLS